MQEKTVQITLDYPVQLADRLLTEINVRRVTVGDTIAFPISSEKDFLGEARLIAQICDLNVEDIKALDLVDYEKIQNQISLFRNNTTRYEESKKTNLKLS